MEFVNLLNFIINPAIKIFIKLKVLKLNKTVWKNG